MPTHQRESSMFHRRLVLLFAAMAALTVGLGAQLVRLAVAQGPDHLSEAEGRLRRRSYLATYRGAVLDRNGVVLAVDQASYDVAVPFDVITGAWASGQAAAAARARHGAGAWAEWPRAAQVEAIEAELPAFETRLETLWAHVRRLGGIDQAELDRRLDLIRREVQSMAAVVWADQWRRERERRGPEAADRFRPRPIREQEEAHVVLPRVSDEVAFEFRNIADELPGMVEVRSSRRRSYPWTTIRVVVDRSRFPTRIRADEPIEVTVDGVADHLLGAMRDDVWAEDIARRPFIDAETGDVDLGGYRPGDSVGARGVERSCEHLLRGQRGVVLERRGTGQTRRLEPVPGRDLRLTIDILLQARVQALFAPEVGLSVVQPWQRNGRLPVGRVLNGAAVVMDVETGEVLALVSAPTISAGRALDEEARRLAGPWLNRPVEVAYPPGSILKPLVLAAAATEGEHGLGDTIECTGHYFPDVRNAARCWIYREKWDFRTHGPQMPTEALAHSCNIFFYTLADRLGMKRLSAWLRRFGLGAPLDTGLLVAGEDAEGRPVALQEVGGDVPDAAVVDELRRQGQLRFSSIILGIGQGPVTWTPLHAANAYATLARGGTIRDATLLLDDGPGRRPRRDDLALDPRLVETALAGLRGAVSEGGTGHHITHLDDGTREPIITATGVDVWAKTGTAQAPAIDLDGDGAIDPETEAGFDHAWFVGLVGPAGGRPLFSIAVIVEYGGSGGRTAGPIANQVIHALQEEKYLPRGGST
ncbi:MAG: penicillin-binding transpeptidase domain-containing protein [Planctomycetota bacterium]|jgi:penicillin-binding protein 2